MQKVTGSCNGCGRCCEILAVEVTSVAMIDRVPHIRLPGPVTDQYRYFLEMRGVEIGANGRDIKVPNANGVILRDLHGKPGVLMRSVCPHLTTEKKCDLHGTGLKPVVCSIYPLRPEDLVLVKPDCSYEVTEA